MATNNCVNTQMPATGGYARDIANLSSATDGQIVMGSTGTTPVLGSLTAGANITITPGAGSISIAASGGSGITWLPKPDHTITINLAPNTGYLLTDATGAYTFALNESIGASVGDIIYIVAANTNTGTGWNIALAGGTLTTDIWYNGASTRAGILGILGSNTGTTCSAILVCSEISGVASIWSVVSTSGTLLIS